MEQAGVNATSLSMAESNGKGLLIRRAAGLLRVGRGLQIAGKRSSVGASRVEISTSSTMVAGWM